MNLPWLDPGEPFPDASEAWDASQPAPGLLAAGGALDVDSLHRAYSAGIFPWFSEGQPILWWSTDPRMVLFTGEFKLHRSLRKTLARFVADPRCELRIDTRFRRGDPGLLAAASGPGQSGTWIVPADGRAPTRHSTAPASRTASKPGSTAGWPAACTAWRSAGPCSANRCSRACPTRPRSHWPA